MSTRFDKLKEMVANKKATIALAAGTASLTLVQYASAATLNESISPILTSVTELFVPLLALIIAAVPLIIALAVIGFILGILGAILGKLNI
jgi:VIT1/CCC1 family predicted Fe2+/Mn2+ transporter